MNPLTVFLPLAPRLRHGRDMPDAGESVHTPRGGRHAYRRVRLCPAGVCRWFLGCAVGDHP